VTTIDNLSGWNGTDTIFAFGELFGATYGQTVTVGTDNVLNNFTFLLGQSSDAPVTIRAYVMDWNNAASIATGPILFQSGNLQTTTAGVFETFTINTGSLELVSGNDYLLFFSASNNYDGQLDAAYVASRNSSNTYAGGLYVYQNNGANFNLLTTNAWIKNLVGPGYDLAFTAQFSQVPEPADVILVAIGVAAGLMSRRCRYRSPFTAPATE
jgi:hypothetical protein